MYTHFLKFVIIKSTMEINYFKIFIIPFFRLKIVYKKHHMNKKTLHIYPNY